MARCGGFFHHSGILLRPLIHQRDGMVNFLVTRRLFARGFHDREDVHADCLDLIDDLPKRLARFADKGNAAFDMFTGFGDQALDVLGGACGPLRKFANFLRDPDYVWDSFDAPEDGGAPLSEAIVDSIHPAN